MTTTTASSTELSSPSGVSFTSRLRRLSQLRTPPAALSNGASSLSSPSPSPSVQPRSNRYSLTRAVGLVLSPHSPVFDSHEHFSSSSPSSSLSPARSQSNPHSRSRSQSHSHSLLHGLHQTITAQSAPESRPPHDNQSDPLINQPSRSSSSCDDRPAIASSSSRSTPANEISSSARDMTLPASDPMPVSSESSSSSTESLPPSPPEASTLAPAASPLSTPQEASSDSSVPPKPRSLPTLRLFPHNTQLSRPSLVFTPITRTLPNENCTLRVGRYSERDGVPPANPPNPSAAPIGFKSKVVSRKHCEFTYVNGHWNIKDIGSSSGTFLNHMRLSQPNTPSRSYVLRDGDVVQLGIDFRGGEEMIFRCVRIRVECNRMWQREPNEFNKNTETLINNLGRGVNADYEGCRECSICLNSVLRPYQTLFMAACAHVWHYKCVRRLINSPQYPIFQCPNCRAYTDLNADVDDAMYDEFEAQPGPSDAENQPGDPPATEIGALRAEDPTTPNNRRAPSTIEPSTTPAATRTEAQPESVDQEMALEPDSDSIVAPPTTSERHATTRSQNIDIPTARPLPGMEATLAAMSPVIRGNFEDCPLTPLNDSGLLAFDGRARRI